MYEVEVKVPADLDVIRERLETIDAAHEGTVEQADTYYDAPHRSFETTDEALRLRRERGSATDVPSCNVTYKGPLLEEASKTRVELETRVGDGEAFDAILAHLGFEPVATVEKRREHYDIDGYTVTLDRVVEVGEFVEVECEVETTEDVTNDVRAEGTNERGAEGTNEREVEGTNDVRVERTDGIHEGEPAQVSVADETEIEAARDGAYAVLEKLELDPSEQIRTSYLELLLSS